MYIYIYVYACMYVCIHVCIYYCKLCVHFFFLILQYQDQVSETRFSTLQKTSNNKCMQCFKKLMCMLIFSVPVVMRFVHHQKFEQ